MHNAKGIFNFYDGVIKGTTTLKYICKNTSVVILTEVFLYNLEIKYKKEGLEKGLKKGLISTAKKMLQRKMKISEIEEITGLSKEEIEKLAKENA